ncbi:hypothetical protein COCNU_03G012890 [Cocos nucifera]|uniref:Uncharacterized protein n=1 Tax=Cocos nucifera TaxID=13894 RepID=A0A8K0MZ50_COCNU|nr:hypothetical protein COCNU_03G012890 [Cocos nucifera]
MMLRMELRACRRDLGPKKLLNNGFSSILDAASYFRLFIEHIECLNKNKKSLKEDLQSTKDCFKAMEEKAAKEKKIAIGLKKQLLEKLNEFSKKNKALLNLQRFKATTTDYISIKSRCGGIEWIAHIEIDIR